MAKHLPPDKANPDGKGQSREKACDDLRRAPENVHSPAWHEEVLRLREKNAADGESEFHEWDDAKEAILDSVGRPARTK